MNGKGMVDRQAAMAYLQTATGTDDAAERKTLRQRAAELILPRRRSRTAPTGREGAATPKARSGS